MQINEGREKTLNAFRGGIFSLKKLKERQSKL